MEAKDLMIGDWVNYHDDDKIVPKQVSEITDFKQLQLHDKDNWVIVGEKYCEPIPITPDILEKNGFEELMSESEVSAARFGRKPEPTGVWQYGFGRFDSVAYVPEQSFLRIKFMEGCQADMANIKYVHELQHALRLCGVEKEIIL